MSHLVIFKSAEGKQAYHQSSSLDEAVRFLEHLRNVERVEVARLYKLTEVPVEFKAYFRAELPPGGEPAPAPAPAPVDEVDDADDRHPFEDGAEPVPNGAGGNSKRGLLKR